MPGGYEPTLTDVAKMLYATSGEGPVPEAVCLMDWLVERVPEVHELWKAVNEPLGGGSVSFLDLMDLHFCLHHDQQSDKAYGIATWLLRRLPATRRLLGELEQLGDDMGSLLQYPAYGIDAMKCHRDVERLLATDDWATAEEALDVAGDVGTNYNAWLGIVEGRLRRGEGDADRLREVRDRLRAEAALVRKRPVLEDHLPVLRSILPSEGSREQLAQALEEIAAALRPTEPAEAAPAAS